MAFMFTCTRYPPSVPEKLRWWTWLRIKRLVGTVVGLYGLVGLTTDVFSLASKYGGWFTRLLPPPAASQAVFGFCAGVGVCLVLGTVARHWRATGKRHARLLWSFVKSLPGICLFVWRMAIGGVRIRYGSGPEQDVPSERYWPALTSRRIPKGRISQLRFSIATDGDSRLVIEVDAAYKILFPVGPEVIRKRYSGTVEWEEGVSNGIRRYECRKIAPVHNPFKKTAARMSVWIQVEVVTALLDEAGWEPVKHLFGHALRGSYPFELMAQRGRALGKPPKAEASRNPVQGPV